ncbi:MAG TPA: hypothetical protein VNL96_07745 [Gemmatimonadaceae bacterium]|nr:hypothetical protein [Gemmatimonadaceae bacterium]
MIAPETLFWQDTSGSAPGGIDTTVVRSPLPGGPAAVARFLFSTVPQWVQIAGAIAAVVAAVAIVLYLWKHWSQIRGWIAARPTSWKAGLGAALLVVLSAAGLAGYKTWDFMMHDNSFCTGCHVMEEPFNRFTASEHKELLCHDCHRQGMLANARQLYEWVAERPDRIGPHAPVPNAICAECHVKQDADSAWERIASTAGHRVHLDPRSPAMSKVECVTCHGAEVHRFEAGDASCGQSGCHDGLRVELGKMAAQSPWHCATCHEFSAAVTDTMSRDSARAGLVPSDKQCLECHEMRQKMAAFRPEGEPHGGNCGLCHNPHTHTTPAGAFQSCATSQCHARADTLTPMHRGLREHRLENCGACHAAHSWKTGATDCRSCHTGVADQAVRPRRLPPRSSEEESAALPWRLLRSTERTSGSRGLTLVPAVWHGYGMRIPDGGYAAGRFRWRRQPTTEAASDTARFRHAEHASLSCTSCHSTTMAHGALLPQARDCQGCHHAGDALGRECTRCHSASELAPARTVSVVLAMAVWRDTRTRSLPFAHERHGRPTCSECHAAGRDRAVTKSCASCHQEHHGNASDCTACHGDSRALHDRDLHSSGCTAAGCHSSERSAAVSPSRAVCLACHAEQREHKASKECGQCHMVAWPIAAGGGR